MGPYGIIYANGNKLCDRDQQIHVEMMPPRNEHTVVLEKGSNDGNEAIRITGWMSIPMQCHELKKIDNGVNKIKIGVEKKEKQRSRSRNNPASIYTPEDKISFDTSIRFASVVKFASATMTSGT